MSTGLTLFLFKNRLLRFVTDGLGTLFFGMIDSSIAYELLLEAIKEKLR
jgi:hypothetical protein